MAQVNTICTGSAAPIPPGLRLHLRWLRSHRCGHRHRQQLQSKTECKSQLSHSVAIRLV